jgi:hypothetical protein
MPTTYAIPDGRTVMAATLYTGNGSTQTVNNSAGFYPDFNWIKARSNTGSHVLVNSVVGGTKQLFSNLTDAEQTNTNITNGISSSGIALGNNSAGTGSTNQSAYTYVLWQWLAGGGTAVTNTAGSITSSVSANTTAGFSVVTYTGNEVAGATVGHGLGVAPSMIIVKRRDGTAVDWAVYHASIGATKYLTLNTTAAEGTSSGYWNDTAPTSSVFSLYNSGATNANPRLFVAYCFAPVAGYSAFGSYTGNGSADGPFVYLGFRPKFVMVKRTDATGSWTLLDTSRSLYNVTDDVLRPNTSDAEFAGNTTLDVLSNGFKIRSTWSDVNTSSATYIYMAFAENPTKFANAR